MTGDRRRHLWRVLQGDREDDFEGLVFREDVALLLHVAVASYNDESRQADDAEVIALDGHAPPAAPAGIPPRSAPAQPSEGLSAVGRQPILPSGTPLRVHFTAATFTPRGSHGSCTHAGHTTHLGARHILSIVERGHEDRPLFVAADGARFVVER
jgi:hypothetical protein